MLEVKNLVKEYRPKKGNPVRAVDGISLKFPEKGMVFILGKSGSGKSTLLNLLGGLDKYDSGEIIIKGKSSKDFSQSEFDSYRNTYLGFIFQEYNILNDFNVAQNIAIALQLQGQKATDERINEILKEVDLDGYGGRKPSELSGGQKQRVAIARALVKNPEIIMADEPTGALDSKTGLQVFDTLKKLSEDKLVIVITHDRDFAEMYGDRVIELKDGKVISDIEKYTASAKEVGEGIKVTDDKVIAIKKGYVLTESDVKLINEYLQRNEMLISVDEKVSGDLKRFARINDEGEKESFRQTDESKIKVSEDKKFRLIKSRLPLKNMIVIGASGLKNKPIRLIVTILLSLVAFTMFGLTDTLAAYNKIKATEKSIEESGISEIALVKKETHVRSNEYGDWTETFYSKYSDEEIAEFNQKTGMDFRPVLDVNGVSMITNYFEESPKDSYYSHEFGGALKVDEAYLGKMGLTYQGTLPKEENEIAVSKFYYDAFTEYGYKYGDKVISADSIKSPADFLSKAPTINVSGQEMKITAVIETNFDGNKYSSLKSGNQSMDINITDYFLIQEMEYDVKYGFHGMLFVGEKLWNAMIEAKENENSLYYNIMQYEKDYPVYHSFNTYSDEQTAAGKGKIYYLTDHTGNLKENEIMVGLQDVLGMISDVEYMKFGSSSDKTMELQGKADGYYNAQRYLRDDSNEEFIRAVYGYEIITEEEFDSFITTEVLPYFATNADFLNDVFNYQQYASDGRSTEGSVKIVAVYADDENGNCVVLPNAVIETINEAKNRKYSMIICGNATKDQWKKIIKLHYDEEGQEVAYTLENGAMMTIGMLNDVIETLSEVFLYVGIGFALFAALMLTNFISTSIVFKRREIGILRAVGARGSDVYGIFAIESVIIALINFVLATIATGVITAVIGASFKNQYHISISILNFGIRQVGLIFGVAVAVALIASFLPTFRISRQKPVDAIKK